MMNNPNYKISNANFGSRETQVKVAKFFHDFIGLENSIENHRKYKLS